MKNFFQKQRVILVLLFYVAFIVAIFYGAVFPLMSKINNVNDQIQQEAMKQESDRQHLNELPKIQNQYAAEEKNASSVDVLLDKNDAVLVIEKLEKLADDTNNKITITVQDQTSSKIAVAVKPKTPQDATLLDSLPNVNYLQLKISLRGNFETIGKFVNSLESFEYYSDIIGIQIKKSQVVLGSAVAVSDSSMLNPFNTDGQANLVNNASTVADNKLDALFDVVFYIK